MGRNPVSRVVIIDDNPGFRERLETFVREQDGCSVAGLAADSPTGLNLVSATCPDVVLIDVGLPGDNGLQLARRLAGMELGVRIVLMGENEAAEYERASALAGADAYVSKTEISRLLPALLQPATRTPGWSSMATSPGRSGAIGGATAAGGTLEAVAALTPPMPRYAGWEAALSTATLLAGIALNQPGSALAGALGFAFLSYRQMTLPRLSGGHLGERVLRRTTGVR
jgi:CheY-like chemotaxis protein